MRLGNRDASVRGLVVVLHCRLHVISTVKYSQQKPLGHTNYLNFMLLGPGNCLLQADLIRVVSYFVWIITSILTKIGPEDQTKAQDCQL